MSVAEGALGIATIRRLSRAISMVEDRAPGYETLLAAAYRAEQMAQVIGVTGPPGTGKSTLVDALAKHWAGCGLGLAVLAVDPSSPFSGGAVLGDRIRMDRSAALQDVYFRSISARGEGGGLSAAVCDIIALLNEAGFRRIVIETVGAGQSDLAVAEIADCTLVVGAPGLGDAVQAAKAGLMEVGDVYVINKADLEGATTATAQIDAALAVAYVGSPGLSVTTTTRLSPQPQASLGRLATMRRHGDPSQDETVWRPPVHCVCAANGNGVADLAASVDSFLAWCEATRRLTERQRTRIRSQLVRSLRAALIAPYLDASDARSGALEAWVERIRDGKASPSDAIAALVSSGERGASR